MGYLLAIMVVVFAPIIYFMGKYVVVIRLSEDLPLRKVRELDSVTVVFSMDKGDQEKDAQTLTIKE